MSKRDEFDEMDSSYETDNVFDKLEREVCKEVVEDDTVGKYGSVFCSDSFGGDAGPVGVREEMREKLLCANERMHQGYDEDVEEKEKEREKKEQANSEPVKNNAESKKNVKGSAERMINADVYGIAKCDGTWRGMAVHRENVNDENECLGQDSAADNKKDVMDIMNEGSCEMTRFVRRVIPGRGNQTRNLPGSDRIADHRFKSRFKVEHITFKNYQDKFIRYDDLSPVEKYELYRYAVFMLTSTVSANKPSFFKKIMKFGNDDKTEVCHIHPFIFKIMDFIKTKRANYHGIFRCSGDYRASTRLYEKFIAGEVFDLNTTDVRNIVAFFKIYLKKKVNGIFSFDILDTLYETAKHRSSPSINYLLFYLPFCFVGDKRKFLIGLIDMFKEIDQHKDENDMPIPNLVRCIAPSLFPDTRLKSIETVFYQTWAVQKLFDIDLEKVPKPLLEFSHVYVVEKSSFSIC